MRYWKKCHFWVERGFTSEAAKLLNFQERMPLDLETGKQTSEVENMGN